ncbi:FAD/NAD(P)-binding protein [Tistrella sp. BH-R2-4]|uniref:FAD/NAD(P)-binding protein n=1 Tax=Tistrella arctica TaxID=3133430 RepID=A0ABU9YFB2_9PROT
MATKGTTIAIIGAGFSGALLAVHLLDRCRQQDKILLVERNSQFGRGVAYATGNPHHLLNVRAGNMSAFPDQPDHFIRWLDSHAGTLGPREPAGRDGFVPRRIYGSYIQDLIADRIWGCGKAMNLHLIHDSAVGLEPVPGGGFMMEVDGGRRYPIDAAVLALGNFPPGADIVPSPAYAANPWAPGALEGIDRDATVMLIGTGLTAVDVVISLLDRGHRGPIHAISRRGLLPRAHAPVPAPLPSLDPTMAPPRLSALLHAVRQAARQAEADLAAQGRGGGWRAVIDGLRPVTQALWRGLDAAEQRRFLRHLRPWWDIHRHRMAPDVATRIGDARARGQLLIRAMRIRARHIDADRAAFDLVPRGGGPAERVIAARAIDCTGPGGNLAHTTEPVLAGLFRCGHIRADALALGLDVDDDLRLIDAHGRADRRLAAVGPLTKGVFWESTAVPDIRNQVAALAASLAAELMSYAQTEDVI